MLGIIKSFFNNTLNTINSLDFNERAFNDVDICIDMLKSNSSLGLFDLYLQHQNIFKDERFIKFLMNQDKLKKNKGKKSYFRQIPEWERKNMMFGVYGREVAIAYHIYEGAMSMLNHYN